ncbi:MAG: 50S ribosomal protein L32 [Bacteroidia bacterium]|nr:MAG: 50S ribosomal protein L32 [Bacteroidia bacterium]
MAHPKSKVSKQRRDTRRAHHALSPVTLSECSNCGTMIPRHHVCPDCGYYRGQQLIAKEEER